MRWRLLLTAVTTALLCAVLPAVASAQAGGVPWVTVDPVIAGQPQAGQTLTTRAEWTGDPTPTVAWRWQRCSAADDSCSSIGGANKDTYVVAAADIGSRLRVRLTITNPVGEDVHFSDFTAVVQAAPPAPTPSPAPNPSPAPPTATPAAPAPSPVSPGGSQASLPPPLLDPFPVVRIRGLLTPTGARITLFTVRMPGGDVALDVRCRGASCPVRKITGRSSDQPLVRLRRFERKLEAGTRFDIKVTQRSRIGKWTTIVIRRGKPPKRSDQCAYPDVREPVPCPSG